MPAEIRLIRRAVRLREFFAAELVAGARAWRDASASPGHHYEWAFFFCSNRWARPHRPEQGLRAVGSPHRRSPIHHGLDARRGVAVKRRTWPTAASHDPVARFVGAGRTGSCLSRAPALRRPGCRRPVKGLRRFSRHADNPASGSTQLGARRRLRPRAGRGRPSPLSHHRARARRALGLRFADAANASLPGAPGRAPRVDLPS